MKKRGMMILALSLLLALIASPLMAGGGSEGGGGTKPGTKIVFVCSNRGDMSFNDSGVAGLQKLEKEGWNIQVVESGEDASKYEAYIREACEDGETGYVMASSTYKEPMETCAAQFPDKRFVIFDVGRDTKVAYPNVLYIVYAQNEGSYLVGMIASKISKSGVVGAVGGVENPVICDFITGYVEGAKAQNPNIKVATGWVGNWTDTAAMLELCTSQYNSSKADVFFPVAGSASTGAFEAAATIGKGTWCIGVDSDQYQLFKAGNNDRLANVIYTSMLKEVGNTFISIFTDVKAGKEYWGTVRTLGVKEKAVGYADNDYFRSLVDKDFLKQLESTRDKIASGELKVKSYFDFANGMTDYNAFINQVKP